MPYISADVIEHKSRYYDFDARAGQERNQRPKSYRYGPVEVLVIVYQLAKKSSYKWAQNNTQRAQKQSYKDSYRSPCDTCACASHQFAEVSWQEEIQNADNDGDYSPSPKSIRRKCREIGPRTAQHAEEWEHRAGQDRDNRTYDANDATQDGKYGQKDIHCYFTTRLVAESGKITFGWKLFASSKSI